MLKFKYFLLTVLISLPTLFAAVEINEREINRCSSVTDYFLLAYNGRGSECRDSLSNYSSLELESGLVYASNFILFLNQLVFSEKDFNLEFTLFEFDYVPEGMGTVESVPAIYRNKRVVASGSALIKKGWSVANILSQLSYPSGAEIGPYAVLAFKSDKDVKLEITHSAPGLQSLATIRPTCLNNPDSAKSMSFYLIDGNPNSEYSLNKCSSSELLTAMPVSYHSRLAEVYDRLVIRLRSSADENQRKEFRRIRSLRIRVSYPEYSEIQGSWKYAGLRYSDNNGKTVNLNDSIGWQDIIALKDIISWADFQKLYQKKIQFIKSKNQNLDPSNSAFFFTLNLEFAIEGIFNSPANNNKPLRVTDLIWHLR